MRIFYNPHFIVKKYTQNVFPTISSFILPLNKKLLWTSYIGQEKYCKCAQLWSFLHLTLSLLFLFYCFWDSNVWALLLGREPRTVLISKKQKFQYRKQTTNYIGFKGLKQLDRKIPLSFMLLILIFNRHWNDRIAFLLSIHILINFLDAWKDFTNNIYIIIIYNLQNYL